MAFVQFRMMIKLAMVSLCLIKFMAIAAPSKVSLENDAERLRKMFQLSQLQAIKGYFEQRMPHLQGVGVSQNNASHGPIGHSEQVLAMPLSTYQSLIDSQRDGNKSGDEKDLALELSSTTSRPDTNKHNHLHNEARQGSLFSGLSPPSLMNPMNNFLRPPSLPALPSLPAFQMPMPRPPPPPKTSIIGGGGGPMALTNDNVVVVNVFSGNW